MSRSHLDTVERLDRTSQDVVLNVSSRYHLGQVALRLGIISIPSLHCLGLETLSSRSRHHTSSLQP